MKKPWFRTQNLTWYVNVAGKQVPLGRDEAGEGRKHPPKAIQDAWHKLERTGEHKDMSFADVADRYAASLKNPTTRGETKRQLDGFRAFLGDCKVSKLRVHHVSDYLATKPTWGTTSQATAIERITSALNWAVAEGLIDDHRVKYKRGQKPRRKRRVVVVKGEHSAAIEAAACPTIRNLLIGLRLSGARPNELCSAMIEKYDREKGILYVWNKTREKTDVEWRPVYCSRAMQEHLAVLIGDRTEGLIFPNSKGGQYPHRQVSHQVREIRMKLGLPDNITPYAARHTFASNAINKGKVNPAHVAKLLGHVDLSQLKVYFHEEYESMREAAEQAGGG